MPLLNFPTGVVVGGTAVTAYFTLNPHGDVRTSHALLLQLEQDLHKLECQEGAILFSIDTTAELSFSSKALPELKRQFDS